MSNTSVVTGVQEELENNYRNFSKDSYSRVQALEEESYVKLFEKRKQLKYADFLKWLQNEINESVRLVDLNYTVSGFLEDACYALSRSVDELHGFVTQKNTGPSGDNPPKMIDVNFADGSRKKVPYGKIALPQLGQDAYIDMSYNSDTRTLHVKGVCEKRFQSLIDEVMTRTKFLVDYDSIYKSKAIKITHPKQSPTFINVSGLDNKNIFLTSQAKSSTIPVEARIDNPDMCKERGLELKFGALLEGDFGTGKTLYAFKLAAKAIKNNWTFVYCPHPEHTLEVLKIVHSFSKNGRGVVLFIEDIDQILNVRSGKTNEISLMLDGGETKDNNVIAVFTTNNIELIDPTFMRGKRIGSVIKFTHLDAVTAKEMIETSFKDGDLRLSDDVSDAAKLVEEYEIVPAFLAEILDRVRANCIYKDTLEISCQDIIDSTESYAMQMKLSKARKTVSDPLNDAFNYMKQSILDGITETVEEGVKEALK